MLCGCRKRQEPRAGWLGLSKALQTAGYAFQPQHLHSIDIGHLQSLLRGGRQRIWDDLDICPRTAPSQGARKCTYARWFRKPFWAGTSPLTLPLTHAAMQRLLRFRTECHGLPKDIGSHRLSIHVPRHQRVCQLCGTGFGDEMHLVFECAAMADMRGQFPDIFQPHQTMQQFMWQPNMLQVAKFLDAGMKRLQTVDPNKGVEHLISQAGWNDVIFLSCLPFRFKLAYRACSYLSRVLGGW